MWQRFQNELSDNSRSGLYVDDSLVAFARAQRNNGGMLRLSAQAIDRQVDEDSWRDELAGRIHGVAGSRSQLTSVLPGDSYQLLLVEVPDVPADEVNSAIRWQIKDLLDFAADDAVVELLGMPEKSSSGDKSMAYAVATRRSNVQSHVELLRDAGVSLHAIDIPELCIRNIAALMPQDADGVGLLHFTESHGILTVTRQGTLYLIRRIENGRSAIRSATTDDFTRAELVSGIVLEIQRSLDYYESHFDRRPLTELVLAPGSDIGGLSESLNDQLSLSVSNLDLGDLAEMKTLTLPDEQGDCLFAVGAALRSALPAN